MKNTIEFDHQINTQDYIDLIYDEDWEKMEMADIIETTFTYLHSSEFKENLDDNTNMSYDEYINNIHFNAHYFTKVGGINFQKWIEFDSETQQLDLLEATETVTKVFQDKIEQIISISGKLNQQLASSKKLLESLENGSPDYLKAENNYIKLDMFIRSIRETKLKLEQATISIIFEAEKAGLKHDLSERQVIQLCNKLDDYDEKIHGGKIMDDSDHLARCYTVMRTQYEDFLSSNEKSFIVSDTIESIKNKLERGYEFKRYTLPEKALLDFMKEEKDIEVVIDNFNSFCEAAQMDYTVVRANVPSASNTDTCLKIPMDENTMSGERFGVLAGHELVCHTTTLLNGQKILGFKGANYIKKEEGIAVLKELIFKYGKNLYSVSLEGKIYIDKEKLDILNDPRILAGELLSGEEFYSFLKDYNLVNKIAGHFTTRYNRLKRGRPFKLPGTQKKDRGYISGLIEVIDFINNGGDIHDLELAKHSLNDTENVKKIYDNLSKLGEKPDLIKINGLDEIIYFRQALKNIKGEFNKTDKQISFSEYCSQEGLEEYAGTFLQFYTDKYPMFNTESDSLLNKSISCEVQKDILTKVATILNSPQQEKK